MQHREYQLGEYFISTDRARVDLQVIHQWLSQTAYWAKGRSLEVVIHSIENSLCFGVYTQAGSQVGFARVVTDFSTFAWLCDVIIQEGHRRKGLGKWLVKTVVAYPDLQGLGRSLLATRDAHELYSRYGGFRLLATPERWMERLNSD